MIFAAGLGTRLGNLTKEKPKALVEINGKTLLENSINYLRMYDISDVIINVHHFADKIISFLEANNNFGMNITISDERNALLETGGGLKKVAKYFAAEDSFVVYNVDILTDLNLFDLINIHNKTSALASLAVRQRDTSRYLLFNNKMILHGWKNIKTNEIKIARNTTAQLSPYAFSGIHVISTDIFRLFTETGKFSIIESYLRLATKYNINGFDHSRGHWFDLGKVGNIAEAEREFPFIIDEEF